MINPKKLAEWRAEAYNQNVQGTLNDHFEQVIRTLIAEVERLQSAGQELEEERTRLERENGRLHAELRGAAAEVERLQSYNDALRKEMEYLQEERDKERLDHISTLGQVQEAYDRGFHAGWTEEREACIRWVEETKALTFSERSVLQAAVARIRARGGDGE